MESPHNDNSRTITVATWNADGANQKQVPGIDALLAKGADVVLLQEVRRETLRELQEKTGVHIASAPYMKKKNFMQRKHLHLAAISKHPIVSCKRPRFDTITLPKIQNRISGTTEAMRFMRLVVQLTDTTRFHITNLHLPLEGGWPHRREKLNEALTAMEDDENPILCGDFNSYMQDLSGSWNLLRHFQHFFYNSVMGVPLGQRKVDEVRALTETLSARNLKRLPYSGASQEWGPVYGRRWLQVPTGFQLDHAACSPGDESSIERVEERFGSDHSPLIFTIQCDSADAQAIQRNEAA